jgi:hypothetical protein
MAILSGLYQLLNVSRPDGYQTSGYVAGLNVRLARLIHHANVRGASISLKFGHPPLKVHPIIFSCDWDKYYGVFPSSPES